MHHPLARTRRLAFIVCAALLAAVSSMTALALAGCGEQASFEQYLDEVRPALDDSVAALDTMADAFEAADKTSPPDFATAAEGCSEASAAWTSARDVAKEISAPQDLEAAHASLVESLSLEADLYDEMGTVLARMGDSLSDPTKLQELVAQLNELNPDEVGQTVKVKTDEWTRTVTQTADDLGVEIPEWLEQWVEDLETAGQRLESL